MYGIVKVIYRISYYTLIGGIIGSTIYTGWASKAFGYLSERILLAYDIMGAGPATIVLGFVGLLLSLMIASIIKG